MININHKLNQFPRKLFKRSKCLCVNNELPCKDVRCLKHYFLITVDNVVVKKQLLCVRHHATLIPSTTLEIRVYIPFDILILKIFLYDSDVLPVVLACNWRLVVLFKNVVLTFGGIHIHFLYKQQEIIIVLRDINALKVGIKKNRHSVRWILTVPVNMLIY